MKIELGRYWWLSDVYGKIPFEILEICPWREYPVEVKTVEFEGRRKKKIITSYKAETIEEAMETGKLIRLKTQPQG